MKFKSRLPSLLFAAAASLVMASPSHATLLGRDIAGQAIAASDGAAIFLYDTAQNITWLRDANRNGAQTWADANAWASGFSLGGFDDWRLPTTLQPDASCDQQGRILGPSFPLQGFGFNCSGGEMGHLWYITLGNSAGFMSNTGDFVDMQFDNYWTATAYAPNPTDAWYFATYNGIQMHLPGTSQFVAMAVRAGDVLVGGGGGDGTVPEPQSALLVLLALAGLGLAQRERRSGNFPIV